MAKRAPDNQDSAGLLGGRQVALKHREVRKVSDEEADFQDAIGWRVADQSGGHRAVNEVPSYNCVAQDKAWTTLPRKNSYVYSWLSAALQNLRGKYFLQSISPFSKNIQKKLVFCVTLLATQEIQWRPSDSSWRHPL